MFLIFIFCLFVHSAAVDPFIVGGSFVQDPQQYPFFASVERDGRHVCGGSFLSRDVVLTAAHCVSFINATQEFTVVNSQQRSTVLRIVHHHGHRRLPSGILSDDIAFLVLDQPFSTARPIAAASDDSAVLEGLILGWGSSKNLSSAVIPIKTNAECVASLILDGVNTTIDEIAGCVCAYAPGIDACQGDSGGPLSTQSGTA